METIGDFAMWTIDFLAFLLVALVLTTAMIAIIFPYRTIENEEEQWLQDNGQSFYIWPDERKHDDDGSPGT
jgi:hypothetical protein